MSDDSIVTFRALMLGFSSAALSYMGLEEVVQRT